MAKSSPALAIVAASPVPAKDLLPLLEELAHGLSTLREVLRDDPGNEHQHFLDVALMLTERVGVIADLAVKAAGGTSYGSTAAMLLPAYIAAEVDRQLGAEVRHG